MESIEFEAIPKNGMIKIPDEHRDGLTKKIRIIVLTEEDKQTDLKKMLLDAPTWDKSDALEFHKAIREGYENWKIAEF